MTETLKIRLASHDENVVLAALAEISERNHFNLLTSVLPHTQSANLPIRSLAVRLAFTIIKIALLDPDNALDEKIKSVLQKILLHLDPDLLKKITKDLDAGDFETRIEALRLLQRLGSNKMAAEVLRICLKDTDHRIRATAVVSLASAATQKDMSTLMAYLKDKDDRVRANTIQALEKIGNKNLVAVLLRFRRDTSNRVRANVLKALWNYGFTEIVPDLEDMLRSPEPQMRASAVWLLGEVAQNQTQLIGLLNLVLDDNSDLVQNTVVRTINKLGDERLEQHFSHILSLEKMRTIKNAILARSRLILTGVDHTKYSVLQLDGELSTFTIIKLRFELEELMKRDKKFIALNLGKVRFVDSSGVGLLVNFNTRLVRKQGNLLIYNCNNDIYELFQTMGIPSLITIIPLAEDVNVLLGKQV